MAKNAVVPVISEKRMQAFERLTDAGKELARDFEEKLSNTARGVIMVRYAMGEELIEACNNEAEYGADLEQNLATYLNVAGGAEDLEKLRKFSETFSLEYVKEMTGRPMADGSFMQLTHWLVLSRVKEKKKVSELIERVLAESMSANDLEREVQSGAGGAMRNVRAGGRKPKLPSTPPAVVQKFYQLTQKLNNYAQAASKSFDGVAKMAPDKVTKSLLEVVTDAEEELDDLEEHLPAVRAQLETARERVTRVLAAKGEKPETDGKPKGTKGTKSTKGTKKAKSSTEAHKGNGTAKSTRQRATA